MQQLTAADDLSPTVFLLYDASPEEREKRAWEQAQAIRDWDQQNKTILKEHAPQYRSDYQAGNALPPGSFGQYFLNRGEQRPAPSDKEMRDFLVQRRESLSKISARCRDVQTKSARRVRVPAPPPIFDSRTRRAGRARMANHAATLGHALGAHSGHATAERPSLERENPAVSGAFKDAGGGTRTPDTRIMIPLLLGSTVLFEGAGGHERGHVRARLSHASSVGHARKAVMSAGPRAGSWKRKACAESG